MMLLKILLLPFNDVCVSIVLNTELSCDPSKDTKLGVSVLTPKQKTVYDVIVLCVGN